jgi:hypothetical protein
VAQTAVESLPGARRALEWPRLAPELVAALTVLALGRRLAAIHQSLVGDEFYRLNARYTSRGLLTLLTSENVRR